MGIRWMTAGVVALALGGALGGAPGSAPAQSGAADQSGSLRGRPGTRQMEAVRGQFQPVNRFGDDLVGSVMLIPENGTLKITLEADGASPGMHMVHLHGFASEDPGEALCPAAGGLDGGRADINEDGYVDLIETRAVSGVTLIPFTDDPASLEVRSDAYPLAGADGRLSYEAEVDVEALREAVAAQHGTPLTLERRVVFIHGAPNDATLPETVDSLMGVPAAVTLPLACAELGGGL